ncbi:MAG: hydroxyacid dehydrogenase [Bacteroidetes bacterium HGW-Bacteroidetes-12]|nr:MAG: hydroxyacid dehydrogenase [Bacteroidetes bacterium HGW-Bacteroidetes-12]
MKRKILFLDTVHPILEERLIQMGFVCEHDYTSSKEEIEKTINNYFGIVIRSRFTIDKQFIDKALKLKFIARSGAGLENIVVAYAEKKNISIFNSPEGNKDAVGEHAIGMLLMLFNKLKQGDAQVRQGIWNREANRGLEIAGKTVGIIGYGHMGSALAKKLSGFDCDVIAYDKYKVSSQKLEGRSWVNEVSLEELKEKSDIISIHLPLTEETQHYVNAKFISSCKKPFYLINTARGNHVKTADLVNALKKGKVLGACLDVLEFESKAFQLSENSSNSTFEYLKQAENVILSPHVAGWTTESYEKLSSFLADKIEVKFKS